MVAWDYVTRIHVLRAIQEYDRLGPERFFSEHGFGPARNYELLWEKRRYPPKAILGTAHEFATGHRLGPGDFECRKAGAVSVLSKLGFTVQPRRPAGKADPRTGARTPSAAPQRPALPHSPLKRNA